MRTATSKPLLFNKEKDSKKIEKKLSNGWCKVLSNSTHIVLDPPAKCSTVLEPSTSSSYSSPESNTPQSDTPSSQTSLPESTSNSNPNSNSLKEQKEKEQREKEAAEKEAREKEQREKEQKEKENSSFTMESVQMVNTLSDIARTQFIKLSNPNIPKSDLIGKPKYTEDDKVFDQSPTIYSNVIHGNLASVLTALQPTSDKRQLWREFERNKGKVEMLPLSHYQDVSYVMD